MAIDVSAWRKRANELLATKRGFWTLAISFGVILVLRALEVRLAGFQRPFWEDEIHHNHAVIVSPTLEAIQNHPMFIAMYQPFLEFALRKLFWFKLFGFQERGLRIPSLFYGVSTVILVYVAISLFLAKRPGWSRVAALLLGFLITLVAVNNETAVHYSTEARHYALIGLASTAWFILFFLYDARPSWLFALTSVILGNTHFFALPIIAGGYGIVILRALWKRQWLALPFAALALYAVYWSTLHINWPQFDQLLHNAPNQTTGEVMPTVATLKTAWKEGWKLWLAYGESLQLPLPPWLIWLFVVASIFFARALLVGRLVCVVFVGLPLFFTYMRVRSTYPFGDRYFAPFTGVGVASLAMAVAAAADLMMKLPERRRMPVGAGVLAVFALLVGAPKFAWGSLADLGQMRVPPENFSPYWKIYEEIKHENVPVFIVHRHCYCNDIVHLYMSWLGSPRTSWFDTIDSRGCEATAQVGKSWVQSFLSDPNKGPKGMVVLDNKESDCKNTPTPSLPPPLSMEKVQSSTWCVYKVRGARTVQELGVAAKAIKMDAASDFFQ